MSADGPSPYREFKEKLCAFADGQHGIRNPFVIAAVDPALEHRIADRLISWVADGEEPPSIPDGVSVQAVYLDELVPRTDVYRLLVDLGGQTSPDRIEATMQDRLAEELVEEIVTDEVGPDDLERQGHVLLLLHLGSLFPFTRASELLDELDRRNVKSTVGIPFPGDVVGGKLNFFGGDSRHYYPAHQIDGQIREEHLQR